MIIDRPLATAPRDTWILLGYHQQGDEMPTGLMVGIGMVGIGRDSADIGKVWIMNTYDNEKVHPTYWAPLPEVAPLE